MMMVFAVFLHFDKLNVIRQMICHIALSHIRHTYLGKVKGFTCNSLYCRIERRVLDMSYIMFKIYNRISHEH